MNLAKKFFGALMIFVFVFAAEISSANAEIVTVEGTGHYFINRGIKETYDDACTHAYEFALRNATEKAGVRVKSYSRTINLELDEDIIETVTGAILEVVGEPIFTNGETNSQHMEIVCKLTARVDLSKITAENFSANDDRLKELDAKNKRIRELESEIERLKSEGNQSGFDTAQNQFLVAKYERDLDIYDFDKKISLQDMMTTAEKLAALDANNATAFRATVYVYRHEDKIQNVIDYCKKILAANSPVDISIEACAQLGDIYYNEIFDTPTAKSFVDRGIALVKKKYSRAEIERFVNGTNVEVNGSTLIGRSNTIRELYILKCDIENVNPKFDSVTVVEDLTLIEDRIYNIKYRTNR